MNRLSLFIGVLLVCSAPALAQPDDAAMAAYMRMMTPGEHHAWLARLAGDWTYEGTLASPDGGSEASAGTSSGEMILGGRYLAGTHAGPMMGHPFEGHSFLGYDNQAQEYVMVFVDNMSTWPTVYRGRRDGDVLSLTASVNSMMTGQPEQHRTEWRLLSDDRYEFTYFSRPEGGEEVPMFAFTYTRTDD